MTAAPFNPFFLKPAILLLALMLTACSRIPTPESPRYTQGVSDTLVRMQLLHTTDRGVLPLVAVVLDGEKSWWLLDTGSSHNLIAPALATRLKLKTVGSSHVSTIGGRQLTEHYRLPDLHIGTLKLQGQSASAVVLSGLPGARGYVISGVLGVPALENLVMALDFRQRTVHFSSHSAAGGVRQNPGDSRIPFQFKGGVPVARVNVYAGRAGDFILDTGNATALVVLPSYARPVVKRRLSFVEVEDLGGAIPIQLARLPQLQLGQHLFQQIPMALPVSNQRMDRADGSIGNAVFAQQPVVFDFPRRQLILKGRGAARANSGGGFGFLLARRNIIAVVVPNSPAQRAGLQVGDRIVAVQGNDTQTLGAHAIWSLLFNRTQAELNVLRGGRILPVSVQRSVYLPELTS